MMNPTGDDCGSIRLRHREYIGLVLSSDAFQTQKYTINPSLSSMFPWGSSIAQQFQEYQLMGMLVCYISTCATALASGDSISLGQVALSTQYNVYQDDPANLGDVLNQQFATTNKVSTDICHPIECMPHQTSTPLLFTRTEDTTGQDLRLYDHANVYVSTDGVPAHADGTPQVLGQLWVTYDIKLTKPRVAVLDGGIVQDAFYSILSAPAFSPALPLGTSQQQRWDGIGLTFQRDPVTVNARITFPAQRPGTWFINLSWLGVSTNQPFLREGAFSFINCTLTPLPYERQAPVNVYNAERSALAGEGTAGSNGLQSSFFVTCTDPNSQFSVVLTGAAWIVPQVCVLNLYVSQANPASQSALAFVPPQQPCCHRPHEEPSDHDLEERMEKMIRRCIEEQKKHSSETQMLE